MANATNAIIEPQVVVTYVTLSFHILSGFLNFFIFYVVHKSAKLHSSSYAFLANACISDFLLSFVFVLFFIVQKTATLTFLDTDILCKLFNYISILSCVVSTYTFTAIAIDRHRSIHSCLNNQFKVMSDKEIFVTITGIWMSAVILSTPLLLLSGTYSYDIHFCDVLPSEPLNAIFFTLMFIVLYFLPLLVMIVMYVRIYAMKNYIQPFHREHQNQPISDQQSLLFIRMLVIISSGFMTLILPIFSFLLLTAYSGLSLEKLRRENLQLYYLAWVFYSMAFSVTFVNPLIYVASDRNIRFVVKICILQLLRLPVREEFLREAKLNQTLSRIRTRRVSAFNLATFTPNASWQNLRRSDERTQTSIVM
ncbi:Neuropeptide FF receptor 2 [Trichoplax sp. H2]|nr:Neuropeptide FF receptor 2 [Trichoplax sp. H2]|eukprot:RDD42327.1 Neuropeptide FF receptor 2 [Trichoplax sp. H2]